MSEFERGRWKLFLRENDDEYFDPPNIIDASDEYPDCGDTDNLSIKSRADLDDLIALLEMARQGLPD